MSRRSIARVAGSFGAGALFCWVAVWNGQPFFYGDTPAYIRGPDYAITRLLGPRAATAWSTGATPEAARGEAGAAAATGREAPAADAPPASLSSVEDATVLAGRSVYYGALLYLGHLAGGFWLSVLLQGALVASVLAVLLRVWVERPLAHLAVLAAALAAGSTLPFFVGFLLPDVLAGAALLAAAAVFAFPERLRRGEVLWLGAVMAFAAVSHTSHVLLLGVVAGFGAATCAPSGRPLRRPLAAVGAALLVAALAGLCFSAAVRFATGEPPLRPPFLMARVVIDGPGARWLEDRCPDAGYALCAFAEVRPRSVNEFLWSRDPERGIFPLASPAQRRALADEQVRFALAAAAAHPGPQLAASARNFASQLSMFGLPEFVYEAGAREWFRAKLPAAHFGRLAKTRAYTGALPVAALASAYAIVAGASLVFVVAGLVRDRRARVGRWWEAARDFRRFAVLVLAGVVSNAAICGVLATPHHRYQTRLLWLLPCLALLDAFRRRRPAPAAAPQRGHVAAPGSTAGRSPGVVPDRPRSGS